MKERREKQAKATDCESEIISVLDIYDIKLNENGDGGEHSTREKRGRDGSNWIESAAIDAGARCSSPFSSNNMIIQVSVSVSRGEI